MKVRIYLDKRHRPRVGVYLRAMHAGARRLGIDVRFVDRADPGRDLLVSYGCGRPDITAAMERQLAAGGRMLHLDAPYWESGMRLALDGLHPTVLPAGGPERFARTGLRLRDDYNPKGHIVLVAMGPKSRHVDRDYESRTLAALREIYPAGDIVYRPKPRRRCAEVDARADPWSPIADVLYGASLVVTRHSNVGIDACLQAIPVCTQTGAAAWLYGNDLANPRRPTADQREDFLQRLAWWSWRDDEAKSPDIWRWIMHCIETIPAPTSNHQIQVRRP